MLRRKFLKIFGVGLTLPLIGKVSANEVNNSEQFSNYINKSKYINQPEKNGWVKGTGWNIKNIITEDDVVSVIINDPIFYISLVPNDVNSYKIGEEVYLNLYELSLKFEVVAVNVNFKDFKTTLKLRKL